jgi:LuxR family maltose regulon positive regulatory protein
LTAVVVLQSFTRAVELGEEAAELARRHGWTDDTAFGLVGTILAGVLTWQAKLEEAERWVHDAERALSAETVQPATSAAARFVRGTLAMTRNRDAEALSAFQAADQAARRLAAPHSLIPRIRAFMLQALVRLGQTERAGQALYGLSDEDREHGEIRIAEAALRLARDDPCAATAVLAPVLDGSAPLVAWRNALVQAYLLEAIARDSLDDKDTAEAALERALDLAEPDGQLTPFLLFPVPGLLERHAGHHTAHASLIAEIRSLLAGTRPAPAGGPEPPLEPLSVSEIRVLPYLPTNLTAPEIARELSLSPNTVRTHIKSLYAKLRTHRRARAVERARALGLLAPRVAAR